MKIILLTHERETNKKSNTGQVVLGCLGEITERVVWQRAQPDPGLVSLIESGSAALLYPDDGNGKISPIELFDTFILIDSTWQESRKIYNRSPYLKGVSKASLPATTESCYQLRRNQVDGGVCTAEAVIALLKLKGQRENAAILQDEFDQFNYRR